jgi:hypothetical protein
MGLIILIFLSWRFAFHHRIQGRPRATKLATPGRTPSADIARPGALEGPPANVKPNSTEQKVSKSNIFLQT